MGVILSLQGCMAAGKTTAARYVQANAPAIHVSFESTASVIQEVRQRKLNKNNDEDYLQIQSLWLRNEIARWERAQAYPHTLMDFGAEEIVFYTLHYPRSIGADWDVQSALKPELEAIKKCMPERILFLDATDKTLRRRRAHDTSRSRDFFEHYLTHLLPLKRAWFFSMDNVDILKTDSLSPNELGSRVKDWAEGWLSR